MFISLIAHTYFFHVIPFTVSFGFQGNCTHSYLGDDKRDGSRERVDKGQF